MHCGSKALRRFALFAASAMMGCSVVFCLVFCLVYSSQFVENKMSEVPCKKEVVHLVTENSDGNPPQPLTPPQILSPTALRAVW